MSSSEGRAFELGAGELLTRVSRLSNPDQCEQAPDDRVREQEHAHSADWRPGRHGGGRDPYATRAIIHFWTRFGVRSRLSA